MPTSDVPYGFPCGPRPDNDRFGDWKVKPRLGGTGSQGRLEPQAISETRHFISFHKQIETDENDGESTKNSETNFERDILIRQAKARLQQFNPHKPLPTHYTQEWVDKSLIQRRLEILNCVEQLSIASSQRNSNRPICSLVQLHDKVTTLYNTISYQEAPLSSVKVQWRVARCRKVPTLQLIFFMLNRISSLTALTKLNNNSALCVFETMEGATRVVNRWGNQQGSRLLILSWWHTQCSISRFKVKQEKDKSRIWLTEKLVILRQSLEALYGRSYINKEDTLAVKDVLRINQEMTANRH